MRIRHRLRIWPILALRILALTLLTNSLITSCALQDNSLLSQVQVSDQILHPGVQHAIELNYHIGKPARVTIQVRDVNKQLYTVRNEEPRPVGDYSYHFTGVVPRPDLGEGTERLLATGASEFIITAVSDDKSTQTTNTPFQIVDSPNLEAVKLDHVTIYPTTISPNQDARDDVAQITYSLNVSATVTLSIWGTLNNTSKEYIVTAPREDGPQTQTLIFNGRLADNTTILPDGIYTYTLKAVDKQTGNATASTGKLTIVNGGNPQAILKDISFSPTKILLGETITVTAHLKNTGKVALRTHGPASGTTYTTAQTFTSADLGLTETSGTSLAERSDTAGLWRLGVDWEGNGGEGTRRYPFRWSFLSDASNGTGELAPGAESVVIGHLTILEKEHKMYFYGGLIEEKISYPQDRQGRQEIDVDF